MDLIRLGEFEVQIINKPIRRMHLYVLPPDGCVRVTAPLHTDDATIRHFVASREAWIRKHRDRMRSAPKKTEPEYLAGETVFLWGQPLETETDFTENRQSARVAGGKMQLTIRVDATREAREKLVFDLYRREMSEQAARLIALWQVRMGVAVTEWHIRRMKTRWGSCNTKAKRIHLNLALAERPQECLEYVIVHELVHLLDASHSKRFYDLLGRYYPDWRTVRASLKKMQDG